VRKHILIVAACLVGGCWQLAAAGERVSFNEGWKFFRGDAPQAERPELDDSQWASLRLPHDWAIEGPFDRNINPHTGALPISGTGWYRKTFTLPAEHRGRYVSIEFDGAMANARVWFNGVELGSRPYGYIGFSFDLAPHARFGGEPNTLAVRLSPEPSSSRWYPGAGIYRNVWLETSGAVHVDRWGTFVKTPEISTGKASVVVETVVRNRRDVAARVRVRSSIRDHTGAEVSRQDVPADVPAAGTRPTTTRLTLRKPRLWDIDQPYLYSLVTEISDGKVVTDRYVTPFGVRSIAFDPDKGFMLNGRRVRLQGVCLHHDLGALGAAVNRRATERQLEIMKAAGVNAIRTSHNPPSPEQLEYADRLGLLVIDEMFDVWKTPKVPNGYNKHFEEWSERDTRDMVRRDRNHPSIIMWSIGNEVPEQNQPNGAAEAARLSSLIRAEDPTRPTTAAFDKWREAIRNELTEQVDIVGFNYKPMHYREILQAHPKWMIYASESASCVSSRGVYHLPIEKYDKHPSLQLSSYDIISPWWANCPDVEFAAQDALPAVLGEFVWTGFDYLGEPSPYFNGKPEETAADWPSRSSYFGMVDLAGFPKDRYYLYQSRWSSKPMVHVLPHWNWEGRAGESIPVMAYSNAQEVELQLNGRSLGRKRRGAETFRMPVAKNVSETLTFESPYRLVWQVPYAPGTLTAIARNGDQEVARMDVRTAAAPARIRLSADRAVITADGDDLSFVTVRIEDGAGNLAPLADNLIRFKVGGAGVIAAVDNGNPATTASFRGDQRQAFNGLALLIVRSRPGESGKIEVEASSEGLTPARLELNAQ
jgi:beta-galactosidase